MPRTSVEFVDRPDLTWTFADSVTSATLESKAVCRIEFCTIRWADLQAGAPASGKQYPVCRIAMPLNAMIALHKRLGHLLSQLEQEEGTTLGRTERSSTLKAIN